MSGDDLADLETLTVASLQRLGLVNAEAITAHLLADLRRHLGGGTLYIHKGFQSRNAQIRAAFNGRNTAALAAQYGLSRRHIERIVNP